MMENYLFIVEGAHDIAFLGKILDMLKFKEVKQIKGLSTLMERFVPSTFPFTKDKLGIFNVVPFFYKNKDKHVAIINANGECNILNKLDQLLSEIELNKIKDINHIVIFADGDLKNRAEKIESILNVDFDDKEYEFLDKNDLDAINPKVNINNMFEIKLDYYIFPDNMSAGRLENIIIEAIRITDESLLINAEKYIYGVDMGYKVSWDKTNSQEEKAKIGIVGNILCPGAANSAVLYSKDVTWISEETRGKIPEIEGVYGFLRRVLGIG
jgi:hypothetical protein